MYSRVYLFEFLLSKLLKAKISTSIPWYYYRDRPQTWSTSSEILCSKAFSTVLFLLRNAHNKIQCSRCLFVNNISNHVKTFYSFFIEPITNYFNNGFFIKCVHSHVTSRVSFLLPVSDERMLLVYEKAIDEKITYAFTAELVPCNKYQNRNTQACVGSLENKRKRLLHCSTTTVRALD